MLGVQAKLVKALDASEFLPHSFFFRFQKSTCQLKTGTTPA